MLIERFENWIGILVFKVSSMDFGCNISLVRVLHSAKQIYTSENLITYDGKDIPFYYMGDLLKLKNGSKIKDKHILIFESIEGPFGFAIDELIEVLPWNKKIFENEVKSNDVADNKFLLGKICFQERTILLPDFNKIINLIKNKQYASF
jgi:hypothetical protein